MEHNKSHEKFGTYDVELLCALLHHPEEGPIGWTERRVNEHNQLQILPTLKCLQLGGNGIEVCMWELCSPEMVDFLASTKASVISFTRMLLLCLTLSVCTCVFQKYTKINVVQIKCHMLQKQLTAKLMLEIKQLHS